VRHRLAIEYLQGTQLPMAEIAQLLGFSNPANFRRAFKRWSAKAPSEVREKSTLLQQGNGVRHPDFGP